MGLAVSGRSSNVDSVEDDPRHRVSERDSAALFELAKFNHEIPQTVEKFKYRDGNKAFHKMAISLRSIAFGAPAVALLAAVAAIVQGQKAGGIVPGRSLYL